MPKQLDVVVSTVNSELRFPFEEKALGRELFEQVCKTLGIREVWYYGLLYSNAKGHKAWLRDDKKLIDQDIPKKTTFALQFQIMLYPENVEGELIQDITRHFFFLEVNNKILSQEIYCPPEMAMMLAAYTAQALYGYYDEEVHKPGFLTIEDFIPQRVIQQFRMTPETWEHTIKQYWREDQYRITREEAELEYLKLAQDLDMYGITYFNITNKKETDLKLGVDAHGINIYEPTDILTPKITFPWHEIRNVAYSDKKFVIKPLDKRSPDFVVYVSKVRINKMILHLSVKNHDRYIKRRQPDAMDIQQMKTQADEERKRKFDDWKQLQQEIEARVSAEKRKDAVGRELALCKESLRVANEKLEEKDHQISILEEKVKVANEEVMKLSKKARKAEEEIKRMQECCDKSEEEKARMTKKALEAEELAREAMFSSEDQAFVGEQLRHQLDEARAAEQYAKMRLHELTLNNHSPSLPHKLPNHYTPDYLEPFLPSSTTQPQQGSNLGGSLSTQMSSSSANASMFVLGAESNGHSPHAHHHQLPPYTTPPLVFRNPTPPPLPPAAAAQLPLPPSTVHFPAPPQPYFAPGGMVPPSMVTTQAGSDSFQDLSLSDQHSLSSHGRSRYMGPELDAIKSKLEALKVEGKLTPIDILYEERFRHGEDKYSVQQQTRSGSTHARINFVEKL
uniref:Merlin-like protein n=1 Tax=Halisarca dujardinii TaxID=2583056 RepID=A0AA49X8R7_HALDU|nr:Merlin-like protein [Halisarca dujardinii]